MRRCGYIFASMVVLAFVAVQMLFSYQVKAEDALKCDETNLYCVMQSADELSKQLTDFPELQISAPQTPIAVFTPSVSKPVTRTVTYAVETRGNIVADLNNFKVLANETYNDSRGWKRLGVQFQEVSSGGDFTLVFSEAGQVPSFGSPCDSTYSCNIGRYVIINQDRWQGATDAWNNAGGNLRDYRNMVVNHETGHWLGHGHIFTPCANYSQPAPIMMQQSIDLHGCKFNPWPLDSEIWSTRLGI
jgi:hypothetical protein